MENQDSKHLDPEEVKEPSAPEAEGSPAADEPQGTVEQETAIASAEAVPEAAPAKDSGTAQKFTDKIALGFQRIIDFLKRIGARIGLFLRTFFTSEKYLAFKAKFLTSKTYRIALFSMKILILALCVLQVVLWGFSLMNPIKDLVTAISDFVTAIDTAIKEHVVLNPDMIIELFGVNTILQILSLLAFIAFLLIFIFQLVIEGFTLFQTRDLRYGSISAFIAFYAVALFLTNLFGEGTMLDELQFGGLFWFIVALILILAIARLVDGDFKKRIASVSFAVAAGILAIVLFSLQSGNFLFFGSTKEFAIGDVNFIRFFTVSLSEENSGTLEWILRSAIATQGTELFMPMVTLVLFFVNTLPYAFLSLLQYCLTITVDKTSKQYYQFKALQSMGILLLIATVLEFGISIWLSSALEGGILVLSYADVFLTIVLEALLIVCSVLPWKIYNRNYKRYVAKLSKN